jgi:hypothetical protein
VIALAWTTEALAVVVAVLVAAVAAIGRAVLELRDRVATLEGRELAEKVSRRRRRTWAP